MYYVNLTFADGNVVSSIVSRSEASALAKDAVEMHRHHQDTGATVLEGINAGPAYDTAEGVWFEWTPAYGWLTHKDTALF